jgi:O-antigen/teichoic acid export membrane protein
VFSRASDAAHRAELRSRITRANVSVTFPLLILFIVFAPRLVPWLFGQRWEPAVLPAQILTVGGMASTLRSLIGPSMLAAAHPKALFVFSFAETVLYGSTVWFASNGTLTTVCLAVAGFQVAAVLIAYGWLMRRKLGLPASQVVRDVGPALGACIPLLAIAWVICHVLLGQAPVLVMVAVAGPIGMAVYLITMRFCFAGAWSDIALLWERVAPRRLRAIFGGDVGVAG